jgi:hypothetical protein
LVTLAAGLAFAAGPPVLKSPPAQTPPPAAKPAQAPAEAKPASGPKAAAPSVSDADLQRAIQARLGRSKISADGFTVKVQGGVAILEGFTAVIQHKGTATRLAKRAGAKRVDNRIRISEEARQKAAARLGHGGEPAKVRVTRAN